MSLLLLMLAEAALFGSRAAAIRAERPQMGWNTWNTFKSNINQSVIEQSADLLVSSGLRDAGYTYLIVDDGWPNSSRSLDGRQQANTTRFPDGMAALGDYIHEAGLRYGIYSDNGIKGCGPDSPGSWGFEELDAATYAAWGVDYLKYDNCGSFHAATIAPPARFRVMGNALVNSGRDIFYSICQWGDQFPWFWADQVGQSYRISGDITTKFSDQGEDCDCRTAYCLNTGYAGCSVMTIIRKMREISQFQHAGSFADMDMLEIGVANMTEEQQKTHFAFWAALKSPLIIGADLTQISNTSLAILKHPGILAISQDELATAVRYLPDLSQEKSYQVWAGPLSGNRTVLLVFNELESDHIINLPISASMGLDATVTYNMADVWSGAQNSSASKQVSVSVAAYETKVLIFCANAAVEGYAK
ncbi:hypothetical protein KC331_g2207 [Hortaea werneckii]|uniref:Alpha-galactosidase n=1 Tax=Hortaea werneckii TaxID=91943 RepID=A0A3M7CYU0_HORWE|nr:hypothetical protein KC331_g2207 [Hortaea werneckii]KAI7721013.1 hypothetical protein KC353_g1711 [Hortaea werneckii]RMY57328.1 hypothetical protein D0865_03173 [Hortaea werneckii]